jgi:hypothetical protein
MTTLPLQKLPDRLISLAVSHHAALSIAAKLRPSRQIRDANSTGVTELLTEVFHRRFSTPSYIPSPDPNSLLQTDEEPDRKSYAEGNRPLRGSNVTNVILGHVSHNGSRCSVCDMSFGKRYGETLRDFIHVHHLIPL